MNCNAKAIDGVIDSVGLAVCALAPPPLTDLILIREPHCSLDGPNSDLEHTQSPLIDIILGTVPIHHAGRAEGHVVEKWRAETEVQSGGVKCKQNCHMREWSANTELLYNLE